MGGILVYKKIQERLEINLRHQESIEFKRRAAKLKPQLKIRVRSPQYQVM